MSEAIFKDDEDRFRFLARKGDRRKVRLARKLRAETTMPLIWIARRLAMGSRGYLTWLLQRAKKHGYDNTID